MVRRRHGSEPDRTCAELEKLIQEQTVLKVNYKGSISYRNAAKVQRRSRKKDEGALLAAAARRSGVEEASHSDLSNGDSAFGPVDQDEEDLEVTPPRGWGGRGGVFAAGVVRGERRARPAEPERLIVTSTSSRNCLLRGGIKDNNTWRKE